MENVKEGNSFKWNVSVGNGEIFVGKIYLSKSKSMCRDFKEIFAIGENKGKIEGVSCKRDGNNGWCRLKKENAHTCALEEPQGFFDQITNDFESTVNQSSEWWRGTKDWWYR